WETSIGRSNLCDIVLGYNSVSRAHAVISRRIDGWYIFDLMTKNGIEINGKKLEKSATIQNGDVLTIGTASFKFLVSNDPVQAAGRKSKKKAAQKPAAPRPQTQRPQGQPSPNGTYRPPTGTDYPYGTGGQPYQQNSVPETGKTGDPAIVNPKTGAIVVLRGNLVSIGRGNTCDLKLADPSVSRKHASLVLYEDGWAIEDSGSTSGTYLNGQKVLSPQLLFDGDTITLGTTNLKFQVLSRTYN
ncbi:MAG: FHA domain-containing protein, partial [Acutalibacteraceae bacterium]